MSGYRQLHTHMWSDTWFIDLTPLQKLLFIYLFSNERASVSGLYEIPLRIISFETGLDRDEIKKSLEVFDKADKIHYDFEAGVVWVVNMTKYQATSSPRVQARIKADIENVPACNLKKCFLDTVSIAYADGIDTSILIKSQSQSVSDSEEGGVGGETVPVAVQTQAPPGDPVEAEFSAHFGDFLSQRERERWRILSEVVGFARLQEIATWAERHEIHMLNRGRLLDSLETAAKDWIDNKPKLKGDNSEFFKNLAIAAEGKT